MFRLTGWFPFHVFGLLSFRASGHRVENCSSRYCLLNAERARRWCHLLLGRVPTNCRTGALRYCSLVFIRPSVRAPICGRQTEAQPLPSQKIPYLVNKGVYISISSHQFSLVPVFIRNYAKVLLAVIHAHAL